MAANESPSTHQRFARDVIVVGLATGLVALSTIFIVPLITRTLGDTEYGIWAQSFATISIGLVFVGLGLPYPMMRFLPATTDKAAIRDDVYSALCVSLLFTLVASAAMVVFAGPIADTFFDGATQVVRLTALIILVYAPTSMCLSYFRAFSRMKTYALFVLIDAYGQVGIVACLVLNGYGLVSIFVGVAALRTLLLVCLLAYVTQQIGIGRPRFIRTKEYLRFGVPAMPALLSWWVVSSSDRYVIAGYLGLDSVGIYSAAYSVGNTIILIVSVLAFVLTPTLSRLYDEEKMNELSTQISYSLKYFLMLAIPFVVGAAVLARPLLTLFSTPSMASRGNVVLPLIALSILLYGAYVIVGQVLVLTKKAAFLGLVWVAAATLNLALNIAIVPHLGIAGSALSSLMAYAMVLGIVSHSSYRQVRFPLDWRFLGMSLVASGLMALVIWLIGPETRPQTVATVAAGVVAYAIGLMLLKAIRKDEIDFFRGLLRGRSGQGPKE